MGIPRWYRRVGGLFMALALIMGQPSLAQELPIGGAPSSPVTTSVPGLLGATDEGASQDGARKTLRVEKFLVSGNTLLSQEEIRSAVASFEGQDLSLEQMKEVAARLTDLYRARGYLLVRAIVPKQPFDTSTVNLKVLEGKIGKVLVEGGKHYSTDFIQRHVKAATIDGNFQVDRFQRQLLLLNEYSDLRAQAVLRPGADPGVADVTVKVTDKNPIHFGLDYNNFGIPETGEHRFGFTFDAGNLFTQGSDFRFRGVLQTPTDHGATFFQLRYQAPVSVNGTRVGVEYQRGAFSSGSGIAQVLDVRGDADIVSAFASYPLVRVLNHSSDIAGTLSHKSVRNDIFGNQPFAREDYWTAKLDYRGDWRGIGGRSLLNASLTQGFGGGGSGWTTNLRADGSFTKLNLEALRIQQLGHSFYGVLRGGGQLSFNPLYSLEQYAIGGISTVRGFTQAELLGDSGYSVSAELRWSPISSNPESFQVVTFIDHGGVSIKDKYPGELPVDNLTGAGFGFRSTVGENTHLTLDIGFPISPGRTRRGDNVAVYGGIQTRF